MKYAEKLKDPRWQRKRLEIMERDKFKCQFCDDHMSTLAVHHLEYYGDPWEAQSDRIITYCEFCHTKAHEMDGCIHNKIFGTVGCFPMCPGFLSIYRDGISCEPLLVAVYHEWITQHSERTERCPDT